MFYSIIIPFYNAEKTIERCIKSILIQDFTDYEVLLVNDGSYDKSGEKVSSLIENDMRFTLINNKHAGVSHSRNTGISNAKGDFVMFVDADDSLEPLCLKMIHDTILSEHCQILIFGYNTIKNNIKTPYVSELISPVNTNTALNALYTDCSVEGFSWNKVFSANMLLKYRFDEALSHCEDLVFNTILLSECSQNVYVLPMPLYNYYQSNTSQTTHFFNDDMTFCYDPAFKKIESYLSTTGIKNNNEILTNVRHKYLEILQYTMYCLLTSKPFNSKNINILKKLLFKNITRLLNDKHYKIRQKMHYFILCIMPKLYAILKLI